MQTRGIQPIFECLLRGRPFYDLLLRSIYISERIFSQKGSDLPWHSLSTVAHAFHRDSVSNLWREHIRCAVSWFGACKFVKRVDHDLYNFKE